MSGWEEWVRWFSLGVLWVGIVINGRLAWRRSRQLKAVDEERYDEGLMNRAAMAKHTGLSDLQIQVAMDDAIASFHQRVAELQRSNRG